MRIIDNMLIIYAPYHRLHKPTKEIHNGTPQDHGDQPGRIEAIVSALKLEGHEIIEETLDKTGQIKAVHSPEYVDFLLRLKKEPWSGRGFNHDDLKNRMTPFSSGAAIAAIASASAAIKGAEEAFLGRDCFVLTRPPGHHAGYDYAQGICYLNNAAIAAYFIAGLGELGFSVAILDFDIHHGNGTQELVARAMLNKNIRYVSVHGDPDNPRLYVPNREIVKDYVPERILNLPVPGLSSNDEYLRIFQRAIDFCSDAQYLVISAGFDISSQDRHSVFSLEQSIFAEMGRMLGGLSQRKLILLEGGYYGREEKYAPLAKDVNSFIIGLENKV